MELRQLRYFAKVGELLNYSEAAKALFISQSTLSQQIKQLEDELKCKLLMRNSHSVMLTDAGKYFLEDAKRTIQQADLCISRITDVQNLQIGTLDIGCTYTFSPILRESVLQYIRKFPNIKLNIVCKSMEELMTLLQHQEVDFVLSYKPYGSFENIESHILFDNKLCVIVSENHPLASMKSITLSELQPHKLALPSNGLQARNTFDHIIREKGYKFDVRLEINEVSILLSLVSKSQLVTVLSKASLTNFEGLVAIPIDVANNDMEGCFHLVKGMYVKKAAKEFIRILSDNNSVNLMRQKWFDEML
jgi:LysR family transcriptional regulator, cyn operon transcriptional activator